MARNGLLDRPSVLAEVTAPGLGLPPRPPPLLCVGKGPFLGEGRG